jgi:drug/metabolite transporter (DMT)-like permease
LLSLLNSPLTGMLVLLVALLCLPVYYAAYRRLPEPKPARSLVRYLGTAFALGLAGFVAGMILGILAFCSAEDAGNLCGLAGVFGTGPLLAAIAAIAYAHFWARSARRAH